MYFWFYIKLYYTNLCKYFCIEKYYIPIELKIGKHLNLSRGVENETIKP